MSSRDAEGKASTITISSVPRSEHTALRVQSQGGEGFLFNQGVLIKDFRHFTGEHTDILKQHAQKMAADAGRPYEYHRFKTRKDDYALKMAQRDGITDGLICVIARNEENHSFGWRYGKGRPELVRNSPKSLTLYYYCIVISV